MRTSHTFSRRVAELVPVLFVVCSLASGQTGTASLRGAVVDPEGASVAGAEISLSNASNGYLRTMRTGKDGSYQFLEVPPAMYTLTVTVEGFATTKDEGVQVLVNTPATLNITLRLGKITTTVEVVNNAPAVNTQDATIGNTFAQTQISALPFDGRDPVGILSLQPGVVTVADRGQVNEASDSRGGSVNGARSDQTNITVDGIDNNDALMGTAFTGALRSTLDSIQEFRVTTTNADASQGRSSGAQVSLITKSGTNKVHGSAYEYHRPTNLVANDYFNKRAQLNSGLPNTPPHLLRNTFGATVGGPIKQDRVFYFLSYEGQRTRENVQPIRVVPSASLRDDGLTSL